MTDVHQRETVLFLHIPKTGGESLWHALSRAHGNARVLRVKNGSMPDNTARIDALLRDAPGRYRVVGGHFHYDPARPNPHMTLLRDPVERALSAYFFSLQRKRSRRREQLSQPGMMPEQGIRHIAPDLQVRLLAGLPKGQPPTPADLETAKHHLSTRFAGVGILERFHESLLLYQAVFGGRLPYYIRRNTGKQRPPTIDPALRQAAMEHNPLDRELYAYACELFTERLSRCQPALSRRLFLFERTLPAWQTAYRLKSRLRHPAR